MLVRYVGTTDKAIKFVDKSGKVFALLESVRVPLPDQRVLSLSKDVKPNYNVTPTGRAVSFECWIGLQPGDVFDFISKEFIDIPDDKLTPFEGWYDPTLVGRHGRTRYAGQSATKSSRWSKRWG